ncbi:hypothetical protein BLOT_001757 [Blomia tropicalis]|nr:hypothetical protein BLOT_001757 [Blomia tropicalis]
MSEKNICEQLKMNRTDIDVIGMTNDYILTVLVRKERMRKFIKCNHSFNSEEMSVQQVNI